MKTFDKKDVFCSFNVEDAQKYIGKLGYFGNTLKELKKWVDNYPPDKLEKILKDDDDGTRIFKVDDPEPFVFCLFLPADKVKEVKEEKKYRPFKNLNELKKCISKDTLTCLDHGIEIIDTSKGNQYRLMILGTFTNGIILPLYGELTMEQLFKRFKININGTWQPFGIEE